MQNIRSRKVFVEWGACSHHVVALEHIQVFVAKWRTQTCQWRRVGLQYTTRRALNIHRRVFFVVCQYRSQQASKYVECVYNDIYKITSTLFYEFIICYILHILSTLFHVKISSTLFAEFSSKAGNQRLPADPEVFADERTDIQQSLPWQTLLFFKRD